MEYIDDLSYSSIVSLIQGEADKASVILNICANELEEVRKGIEETQRTLNRAKSRENTLLRASQDIVKHIKKELPLAVMREDYLVVVSKDNLSIERNVI